VNEEVREDEEDELNLQSDGIEWEGVGESGCYGCMYPINQNNCRYAFC